MKIVFTDTFWKSLKKLRKHNTWWYKTYSLFRWDLPYFFKNVFRFRRELWDYRAYDYCYTLLLMRRGLMHLADLIDRRGYEVDDSRLKKVEKMRRAIEILTNHKEDKFYSLAEKQMGRKINHDYPLMKEPKKVQAQNSEIYTLARKIEADQWEEFCSIIKGQSDEIGVLDSGFDGSGIKGWWN